MDGVRQSRCGQIHSFSRCSLIYGHCFRTGYYVHLSTYAEVREEVLKYIPVMARPMVLNPSRKPNPAWTPVYADVTDPKLTNWLWINRQRNKQRDIFLMYRRNRTLFNPDEQDRKYVHQQKLVRAFSCVWTQ